MNDLNKIIKRFARNDLRNYTNQLYEFIEDAAYRYNLGEVYKIIQSIANMPKNKENVKRNKQNIQRWFEYFKETLNNPNSISEPRDYEDIISNDLLLII